MGSDRTTVARAALGAVAFLWAGLVVGVVLVAVPAQFATPGLGRTLGIDVTRHVFDAFDRVEIGLALLTLILAGLGRPPRGVLLALGLIWLVVAAESLWLLPILDARVELVLAGEVPPAAPWHRLYGDLELLKLRALLALGVALLWRPRRPASRSEVCPSRASRAGSRTRSAGGSET